MVYLKEPSINTTVTRKMLQNRIDISIQTGKDSTDKFFTAIVEAMNQLQMDNVYERIKEAFDQSQKEVDDLHKRTSEGLRTAKLEGKQIGRKPGATFETKKSVEAKQEILKKSKAFGGTYSDKDLMKVIGVARNSYYKYKKELQQSH